MEHFNFKPLAKKALLYMLLFGFILLAGSYIFVSLEASQEKHKKLLKANFDNFKVQVQNNCTLPQDTLEKYYALKKKYVDFQGGINTKQAFHLSVSIAFTTGFGTHVPTTDSSKVFFLVYSCISISIATIMLKTIGDITLGLLAKLLQWVEERTSGERPLRYVYLKCVVLSMISLVIFIVVDSAVFVKEGYTVIDAVYGCFQTYSTIGFGDLNGEIMPEDSNNWTEFGTLLTNIIGMSLLATVINSLIKFQEKGLDKIEQRLSLTSAYVQEHIKLRQVLGPEFRIDHHYENVMPIPCKNALKEARFTEQ